MQQDQTDGRRDGWTEGSHLQGVIKVGPGQQLDELGRVLEVDGGCKRRDTSVTTSEPDNRHIVVR